MREQWQKLCRALSVCLSLLFCPLWLSPSGPCVNPRVQTRCENRLRHLPKPRQTAGFGSYGGCSKRDWTDKLDMHAQRVSAGSSEAQKKQRGSLIRLYFFFLVHFLPVHSASPFRIARTVAFFSILLLVLSVRLPCTAALLVLPLRFRQGTHPRCRTIPLLLFHRVSGVFPPRALSGAECQNAERRRN